VTWQFLTVEDVVALHRALINDTGGSHGLRDAGLLGSAIARAENKVNYDPEATVPTVGASLSWGLIKNHAFIDGNKRIGLAALVVFVKANGFSFDSSPAEETAMVLRAAASEITEDEWTAWVSRVVANT
jgi:death-on-curing protein